MRTLKCMVLGALSAISMPATMLAQTVDLNLQKAIEIALAENPTIKIADKDIRLKEIADKEAWQSLLPTVSSQLALQHSIKVAAIKTPNGEFKWVKMALLLPPAESLCHCLFMLLLSIRI